MLNYQRLNVIIVPLYTHYIPMNIPMELLVCLPEGIFQLWGLQWTTRDVDLMAARVKLRRVPAIHCLLSKTSSWVRFLLICNTCVYIYMCIYIYVIHISWKTMQVSKPSPSHSESRSFPPTTLKPHSPSALQLPGIQKKRTETNRKTKPRFRPSLRTEVGSCYGCVWFFWWFGVLWSSFKPFPLLFPRCSAKKEQQNPRPPASPKSIKGSLGGSLNAGWMASQRATGQKDCHKIHIGFSTGIAEGKNMGPKNPLDHHHHHHHHHFLSNIYINPGVGIFPPHRTFRISGRSSPECRLPWRPWIAAQRSPSGRITTPWAPPPGGRRGFWSSQHD